jgi:hypothetical protein
MAENGAGPVASGTQCLPTCLGGTSGAYLVRTASLPWGRSGTRRASKNGKQGRIRGVASRYGKSKSVINLIYTEEHDYQYTVQAEEDRSPALCTLFLIGGGRGDR